MGASTSDNVSGRTRAARKKRNAEGSVTWDETVVALESDVVGGDRRKERQTKMERQ